MTDSTLRPAGDPPLAIEAGYAAHLDRLIAEYLFGWSNLTWHGTAGGRAFIGREGWTKYARGWHGTSPEGDSTHMGNRFTRDVTGAQKVLDELSERGWLTDLTRLGDGPWQVTLTGPQGQRGEARAYALPMAVARATLLALGVSLDGLPTLDRPNYPRREV